MAIIPTADTDRLIPVARRPEVIDRSADIRAQGLGEAASTIVKTAGAYADHQASLEAASSLSALQVEDLRARRELENDPDYASAEARYRDRLTTMSDAASQNLRGENLGAFANQSALLIERGATALAQTARARAADAGRASVDQLLSDSVEQYAQAGDDATRNAIMRNAGDGVVSATHRGYLSAEEALQKQRAFVSTAAVTRIQSLPAGQRLALLSDDSGVARFIPAEKRAALLDRATADHATDQIVSTYEQRGTDAGTRALEALGHSGLDVLTRDEVRGRVNTALAQLREQRQGEHADELANLSQSIAAGTAGREAFDTVDRLYQVGALSPAQRAAQIASIEQGFVERAKHQAGAEQIRAAFAAGLPLDAANIEQRKALSQAFTQDTQQFQPGSPEWLATASAYAAKTRVLPTPALAYLRQTVRSPDPKIAAAGAQFYGALAGQAPDALGELDADTKAFAGTVSSMLEAGTDPARAVQTARANIFDLPRAVLDQRKDTYRTLVKANDAALESFIDRDFDPSIFTAQPAASAGLKADFNAQASRYYTKTGDIEIARNLAFQDLQRIYGPSRVNGDATMVPFPVERFGIAPAEVRADIGAFLNANPQADGSTAADVYVLADAITLRQVSDALDGRTAQPSYKLVSKSGDLVLDRHGVPKRYTLPSGQELGKRFKAAQEQAEAQVQEDLRRTRATRDLRRLMLEEGPGL